MASSSTPPPLTNSAKTQAASVENTPASMQPSQNISLNLNSRAATKVAPSSYDTNGFVNFLPGDRSIPLQPKLTAAVSVPRYKEPQAHASPLKKDRHHFQKQYVARLKTNIGGRRYANLEVLAREVIKHNRSWHYIQNRPGSIRFHQALELWKTLEFAKTLEPFGALELWKAVELPGSLDLPQDLDLSTAFSLSKTFDLWKALNLQEAIDLWAAIEIWKTHELSEAVEAMDTAKVKRLLNEHWDIHFQIEFGK